MAKEQSTLQKFIAKYQHLKKTWIAEQLGFTKQYLSILLKENNDDNFKVSLIKKINELDERISK